eukprot:Clim_evm5s245 gene=Clim_evmTU5s245
MVHRGITVGILLTLASATGALASPTLSESPDLGPPSMNFVNFAGKEYIAYDSDGGLHGQGQDNKDNPKHMENSNTTIPSGGDLDGNTGNTTASNDNDSLSPGAIVGVCVAAGVVALGAAAAGVFWARKRAMKRRKAALEAAAAAEAGMAPGADKLMFPIPTTVTTEDDDGHYAVPTAVMLTGAKDSVGTGTAGDAGATGGGVYYAIPKSGGLYINGARLNRNDNQYDDLRVPDPTYQVGSNHATPLVVAWLKENRRDKSPGHDHSAALSTSLDDDDNDEGTYATVPPAPGAAGTGGMIGSNGVKKGNEGNGFCTPEPHYDNIDSFSLNEDDSHHLTPNGDEDQRTSTGSDAGYDSADDDEIDDATYDTIQRITPPRPQEPRDHP